MVLSKRERVLKTLELDGEPDMVPIHYSGFEKTAISYQTFIKKKEFIDHKTFIKNNYSRIRYRWAGDITDLRFLNVDCYAIDPWGSKKIKISVKKGPPEYPELLINTINGTLYKYVKQVDTGLNYLWYVGGYFQNPEILHSYWNKYGKPSELINDKLNYSPQIWDDFVISLKDYLYPMVQLPVNLHESLFEGMTMSRGAYLMRKNPQFIHEVLTEYTKTNIEIIKRLSEAGVDIVFYPDDLGYKKRSILSLENFRTFILPYYKLLYQACKKRGIFIVQHSCGYIDKNLPDMVNAGLNCIQALEPAAEVDLANLKKTLGDRLCFMGGIDSSRVLNFGSPKDVANEVKRCINAAAHGGGYFVGPSHDLLNVPWENLMALRAAIEKFRKYPLNLN